MLVLDNLKDYNSTFIQRYNFVSWRRKMKRFGIILCDRELYCCTPLTLFYLNGSVLFSPLPCYPPHPSDVEQMAIDWLTGNFYFVDDVDDRVFVCNKNGQTCVTLLDQELYNPKGIALDPTMGSVFPCSPLDLTLPSVLF